MLSNRFTLSTITALFICSQHISANDNLEEVVVTTKTQQSLAEVLATSHVLTAADIEAAQVNDVPALLDQISGISVNDTGGRGSTTSLLLHWVPQP